MRVTVNDFDEFRECLNDKTSVFDNTIRFAITRVALQATSGQVVSYQVLVSASAVVPVGDDQEYLLEVGRTAGVDHEDSTQDFSGTAAAKAERDKMKEWAKAKGWLVLPGVISD